MQERDVRRDRSNSNELLTGIRAGDLAESDRVQKVGAQHAANRQERNAVCGAAQCRNDGIAGVLVRPDCRRFHALAIPAAKAKLSFIADETRRNATRRARCAKKIHFIGDGRLHKMQIFLILTDQFLYRRDRRAIQHIAAESDRIAVVYHCDRSREIQ